MSVALERICCGLGLPAWTYSRCWSQSFYFRIIFIERKLGFFTNKLATTFTLKFFALVRFACGFGFLVLISSLIDSPIPGKFFENRFGAFLHLRLVFRFWFPGYLIRKFWKISWKPFCRFRQAKSWVFPADHSIPALDSFNFHLILDSRDRLLSFHSSRLWTTIGYATCQQIRRERGLRANLPRAGFAGMCV